MQQKFASANILALREKSNWLAFIATPFLAFKSALFKTYFELFKRPELSRWLSFVILGWFWAQIILAPFADCFKQFWQPSDLASTLNSIFCAITLHPRIFSTSLASQIALCALFLILNGLLLLAVLLLSQKKRMENINVSAAADSAKLIQRAMATFLALPALQAFASTFACVQPSADLAVGQAAPSLVMLNFPGVVCFEGGHLLFSAFSVAGLVVHLSLSVLAALWFHQANVLESSPFGQKPSPFALLLLFWQAILVAFNCLALDSVLAYLAISLLLLGSFALAVLLVFSNPFSDSAVARTAKAAFLAGLWGFLMLLVAKIEEGVLFRGCAAIWLTSLPFVFVAGIVRGLNRSRFLVFAKEKVQTSDVIFGHACCVLELLLKGRERESSRVVLEGFKENHVLLCTQNGCPLTQSELQSSKEGPAAEKLVLAYIDFVCKEALEKFGSNPAFGLFYASFLIQVASRPFEALGVLERLLEGKHSAFYSFTIYQFLKSVKEIRKKESFSLIFERPRTFNESEDVPFQSLFKKFRRELQVSAMLYIELWSHLQDERPSLKTLFRLGGSILFRADRIKKIWAKFSRFFPHVQTRYLLFFGKFLNSVKNEPRRGKEMVERSQKLSTLAATLKFDLSAINAYSDLSQISVPMFFISAAKGSLGAITGLNASAALVFGFTADELRGKPLETILPAFCSGVSAKALARMAQEGKEQVNHLTGLLFGRTSEQYLVPIVLSIRFLLEKSPVFVAQMRISRGYDRAAVIVVDHKGRVKGVSAGVASLLELSAADFSANSLLEAYFPGLFQKRGELAERGTVALSEFVTPAERLQRVAKDKRILLSVDTLKHNEAPGPHFLFRLFLEPDELLQDAQQTRPVGFQFLIGKGTKILTGQLVSPEAGYLAEEADKQVSLQQAKKELARQSFLKTSGVGRGEQTDIKIYRLREGRVLNVDLEEEQSKAQALTLEASDQLARTRQRLEEQQTAKQVLESLSAAGDRSALVEKKPLSRKTKCLLAFILLMILLFVVCSALSYNLKESSFRRIPVHQSVFISYNAIISGLLSAGEAAARLTIKARFPSNADNEQKLRGFLSFSAEDIRGSLATLQETAAVVGEDFLQAILYEEQFKIEKENREIESMGFIEAINYLITVILEISKTPLSKFSWQPTSAQHVFLHAVLGQIYQRQAATNEQLRAFTDEAVSRVLPFVVLNIIKGAAIFLAFAVAVFNSFSSVRQINKRMALFLDIPGFRGRRYLGQCEAFLGALENETVEEFEIDAQPQEQEGHEERAMIVQRKIRRNKAVQIALPKNQLIKYFVLLLFVEAVVWLGFLVTQNSASDLKQTNQQLAVLGRLAPQFGYLLTSQLVRSIENFSEEGMDVEVSSPNAADWSELSQFDNSLDQFLIASEENSASNYSKFLASLRKESLCSLLAETAPSVKAFFVPSADECRQLADDPTKANFVAHGLFVALSTYQEILKSMDAYFFKFMSLSKTLRMTEISTADCKESNFANDFCFFGSPEFAQSYILQDIYISYFSKMIIEQFKIFMSEEEVPFYLSNENWLLTANILIMAVILWLIVFEDFVKKCKLIGNSEQMLMVIPPENVFDSIDICKFYKQIANIAK